MPLGSPDPSTRKLTHNTSVRPRAGKSQLLAGIQQRQDRAFRPDGGAGSGVHSGSGMLRR